MTELMDVGTTMDLSWFADRPGAWIFHCHLNWHVVPNPAARRRHEARQHAVARALRDRTWEIMQQDMTMDNHAEKGMGGLVLAMNIKPAATWKPYTRAARAPAALHPERLPAGRHAARRFGYALAQRQRRAGARAPSSGRGRRSSCTRDSRRASGSSIARPEPSQVHWHGLEIDSYYDGVAGLSSNGGMVSPMIMPRDSFEVTVTPPRAGSFMYHTHVNDMRQQSHGLYGPIVVLPAGETWDPAHDLIFHVGTEPARHADPQRQRIAARAHLHAGTPYRIRLMNISLDVPFNGFVAARERRDVPVWTAMAKDGYDLPAWQRREALARQRVSIGETFDFRMKFAAPGDYAIEGRVGSGAQYAKQIIRVVK